jgi:CubicO group peptidase (beta-lactamase class C family)
MMKRQLLLTLALLACPIAAHAGPSVAPPSPAEVARQADQLLAHGYPGQGPGPAVLIARGDTILYRVARGEADIDKHVPLRPDAMFRIASVTKQFAAAALLKLVEAGKVELDDPLSKYVRGFPNGERITVLQLLNHTSGVKDYTGIPGYGDGPIRQDWSTAQMIDYFRDAPAEFAPGTKWAYSNSNYVLVGAVIEAASGEPWHAYLKRALFKPLGMRHTGYGHDPKVVARQVQGYTYDGDRAVPMLRISMTQPHAAGGLVSSVDDLLKWNRALHEGRVLANDSYARMITPVGEAAGPGIGSGFGIVRDSVRGRERLHHGGGIFGFNSELLYLPGPDITVAVLENEDGHPRHEHPRKLARRLAAIALGEPYPAPVEVAVDTAALKAAEGVYRFEDGARGVLRLVNGRLTVQRNDGPREDLMPIAPDDFLYDDEFGRMRLERDAAGRIAGIRVLAEGDGPGALGTRTDEPLPAEAGALALPRAALERLAGTYVNRGLTMTVFLEGTVLKAQIAGQEAFDLLAVTSTRFQVSGMPAMLEFAAGDQPASGVTLRQSNKTLEMKRSP